MHLSFGELVKFTEISSYLWYLNGKKDINSNVEVLVLGDSQILSGISLETISKLERINEHKILYLVRPSEHPEGYYEQFLRIKNHLPNLKKVYLNISPISVSQNSVTDTHKQLYFDFAPFSINAILEPLLRKAYFQNKYDIFWKLVIEIFPYFGLNQNSSIVLGILPTSSLFYEEDMIRSRDSLNINPTIYLIKKRKEQTDFFTNHFNRNSEWTWKTFGTEKELEEEVLFPKGSSLAFAKRRELSVLIFKKLIEEFKVANIATVCFDIPFSPPLEEDMQIHGVRKILQIELMELKFDKLISIPKTILDKNNYFSDFTHLNQQGREVVKSYLLSGKMK